MGKWSNMTNIFQMGWNHQPEYLWLFPKDSAVIQSSSGAAQYKSSLKQAFWGLVWCKEMRTSMWNSGNVIEQLVRQIKGKLVNQSEDLLLRLDPQFWVFFLLCNDFRSDDEVSFSMKDDVFNSAVPFAVGTTLPKTNIILVAPWKNAWFQVYFLFLGRPILRGNYSFSGSVQQQFFVNFCKCFKVFCSWLVGGMDFASIKLPTWMLWDTYMLYVYLHENHTNQPFM